LDTIKLKRIWESDRKDAVLKGLRSMLSCGLSTIAPQQFGAEGEELLSVWFKILDKVIEGMVRTAAVKLYGEQPSAKDPEVKKAERALKWEEIIDGMGKELLEKLGFLWYAEEAVEPGDFEPEELFSLVGSFSDKEIERFMKALEETEKSYVILPF
jgi:hypothetical protein